jgi:glycosyltransferase involved in cell wall biosynthesis
LLGAKNTGMVGLVFPGDPNAPAIWSGIPAGLASGLEELGVGVRPVSAEMPRALGFVATAALSAARLPRVRGGGPESALRRSRLAVREGSQEVATLRTRALRRRLRRTGPVEALVQIGTGYSLPPDPPRVVTVEDMTVRQAVAIGVPEWRAQSRRTIDSRIERQRRGYEAATSCCLASRWAAGSVTGEYRVPAPKVHVVGLGRNLDPQPVPRDWSSPRFLFVGREWERKNGPAVLRAFGRLRASVEGARLDVVGGHPRIDDPGVHGHGPLELAAEGGRGRLQELFQSATCVVMPSRFEPFGIVHAEAGAAGVPSIGTTIGGASEPIGRNGGRLVDPDEEASLLDAMLELSNGEAAARMGAAALRRSKLFTWRAVAERVVRAVGLPWIPRDALADFL